MEGIVGVDGEHDEFRELQENQLVKAQGYGGQQHRLRPKGQGPDWKGPRDP